MDATFLVAHRAGNDLARLRRAEECGITHVEADLHLFRGRIEVRHLKTVGPLPILWDRWALAAPWQPRLLIDRLLAATGPQTRLMLDLKGHDRRLGALVARALEAEATDRRLTICSRNWGLLEPFRARAGTRLVHSVGSRRQLRLLPRERLGGVSIHRRLLDASVTRELKARADVLLCWPVEATDDARTLAGWGVDGLITQSFERLAPAFRRPAVQAAAG